MKVREFNMMIRPVSKVKKETHYSPNHPNHPRHFTISWRDCYQRECITHEAARQAEEEDRPPVSNHTHPDHGILEWTECVSNDCEIHRDEKEGYNIEIKLRNEEGEGWAQNEDETRRINAYVNDQARINNIRPGTPAPTITKQPTSDLKEGEIVEELEPMEESIETETQHLSTPEESEYDSTDDELDEEFDANHI